MSLAVAELYHQPASRAGSQPGDAIPVLHHLPHEHSRFQRERGVLQFELSKGRAMTRQTEHAYSLVGSPAGRRISRGCALTAAAMLAMSAFSGFGQQPQ